MLYSTDFFRQVGFSVDWAQYFTVLMAVVNVLATGLSLNFVDRFGRRKLLLWFGSLNVLSTLIYVLLAQLATTKEWAKYGCAVVIFAFNATFR
jgi:hypothetical protein